MMRTSSGALAVIAAVLLVSCRADSHQEQEISAEHSPGERFDANGHKTRNLDPLGGGNLVRDIHDPTWNTNMAFRRYDYSPYSGKLKSWPVPPVQYAGYYDGLPKRNFDEIDRSGLDNFVKKRNFDEIDQTLMPFPFKRYVHVYGPRLLGMPDSSFRQAQGGMDEIDATGLPVGSRRSLGGPLSSSFRQAQGGMDEIDATGLPVGSRRSLGGPLSSSFRQAQGGMDEIDATGLPVGFRRSLGGSLSSSFRQAQGGMDEIDATGLPVGSRRSLGGPLSSSFRQAQGGMDEIDATGLPVGSRRSLGGPLSSSFRQYEGFLNPAIASVIYGIWKPLGSPLSSSLDKKRYSFRQDFPMDEIDLSGFPVGSKRSLNTYPLIPRALR